MVRAVLAATERAQTGPYNIGTGIQTSDREVFDTIARACGYGGEPRIESERKGEVRHIALDCRKAERDFGWRAVTEFADGIERTIEHLRTQLG
jgi:UDP-glucose 4-epimerase